MIGVITVFLCGGVCGWAAHWAWMGSRLSAVERPAQPSAEDLHRQIQTATRLAESIAHNMQMLAEAEATSATTCSIYARLLLRDAVHLIELKRSIEPHRPDAAVLYQRMVDEAAAKILRYLRPEQLERFEQAVNRTEAP